MSHLAPSRFSLAQEFFTRGLDIPSQVEEKVGNYLQRSSKRDIQKKLNTAAVGGEWRVAEVGLGEAAKKEGKAPIPKAIVTEDGSKAKPLDGSALEKKQRKEAMSKNLKDWFGLPKQQITPELKREMLALQLKGYAAKDTFISGPERKKLPTHFQIGYVEEGGLRAVGGGAESQAAGTTNRSKKKGKSFLAELLADEKVAEWTSKRAKQYKEKKALEAKGKKSRMEVARLFKKRQAQRRMDRGAIQKKKKGGKK